MPFIALVFFENFKQFNDNKFLFPEMKKFLSPGIDTTNIFDLINDH